jgi:hypothetical protein
MWLRMPFWLSSHLKIRATSSVSLLSCSQLTYLDDKVSVPYPGDRIVEEVYIMYELGAGTPFCLCYDVDEGESEKKFSRQDAPFHHLTAAFISGIPPLLF